MIPLVIGDRANPKLFVERLAGKVPLTFPDILEANVMIRKPWLDPFLRKMGLQPFGKPRHVRRTRLMPFRPLSEIIGRPVYLKREDMQPIKSFKNRGPTYFFVQALLAGKKIDDIHFYAVSAGNHAQGVVVAALNFGIRRHQIHIVLPETASGEKKRQLRSQGANIKLHGSSFDETVDYVREHYLSKDPNALFLPAFDHPLVAAGQGTIGVEIDQQMAAQGHGRYAVVCPAGGGGLLAGLSTAVNSLNPDNPVFGAESAAYPYVSLSFRARRIVHPTQPQSAKSIADGIALRKIGASVFPNILQHVTDVVALPESEISTALLYLHKCGVDIEGSAAVPAAALLVGAFRIPESMPVVVVLSGKNIDPKLLKGIEDRTATHAWSTRKSPWDELMEALARGGFLQKNGHNGQNRSVRALGNSDDTFAFMECVETHLPDGMESMDVMRGLGLV